MPEETEITRTVVIEHAGEKIQIEVHVHLSEDEVRRVLLPLVAQAFADEVRRSTTHWRVSSGSTANI